MEDINFNNITVDNIELPVFAQNNIEADVMRLDKMHPYISGNKWFKLRYYLEDAKTENRKTIFTKGGAWSNHIIATSAAGQLYDFNTIGIIHGDEPATLSPILQQAKAMGMQLIFRSRKNSSNIRAKLTDTEPGDDFYIPEGGAGIKGAAGAGTMLEYCAKENYTHICCAAGTGTTTAGLAWTAALATEIISISVVKNNPEAEKNIHSFVPGPSYEKRVRLIQDYHFGGYAKHKPELLNFMNDLYRQTSIPTDFVYTGKLFFAINDLAAKKYFPAGSKLLLIHTGGLQGNASLEKGTLIF